MRIVVVLVSKELLKRENDICSHQTTKTLQSVGAIGVPDDVVSVSPGDLGVGLQWKVTGAFSVMKYL